MQFKSGDRVNIKEVTFTWSGTVIYTERGFGNNVWLYVRPDEYSVHGRRGSGNREYNSNLIGVPLFLNKVEKLEEEYSPYATANS